MSNSLVTTGGEFTPKSFWSRKEGTVGMVVLATLGVAAVLLLNSWLPGINNFLGMAIAAVGKTMVLAGMLAAFAAVLAIGMNKKVQTLVSFMFQSAVRKATGIFVEIDPIGIMKGYRDRMVARKADLDEQKKNVAGQKRKVKDVIDANELEIGNAMASLKVARDKNIPTQIKLHSTQAERLTAFNGRLAGTLSKIEMIYTLLGKYSEASDLFIQDTSNEIRVRETEMKLGRATSSAISSAKAILFGEGEAKALYDTALEYLLEDFSMRMGEIEDFVDMSTGIMQNIDLQSGVMEAKALERLEAFENQQSRVLGDQKTLLIEQSNGVYLPVTGANEPQRAAVPVASPSDYSKFFANKQ